MWFWLMKMSTQKLLIVCRCWSWCCRNHLWQLSDSWQLVNSLKTALSQLGSRLDLFGQSFESASCSWLVRHLLWQNSGVFGKNDFLCRFSVRGALLEGRRWQHRSHGRFEADVSSLKRLWKKMSISWTLWWINQEILWKFWKTLKIICHESPDMLDQIPRQKSWAAFGRRSLTTQSILVPWWWVVGETEDIPKLTRRLDLHNSRFVLNYLKQRLWSSTVISIRSDKYYL